MKKDERTYCPPAVEVLEMDSEGRICQSDYVVIDPGYDDEIEVPIS